MKKIVVAIVLMASVGLLMNSCKEKKEAEADVEKKVEEVVVEVEKEHDELAAHDNFQCPMKCEKEKTYEAEGNCPVCKMALKKLAMKEEHETEHNEEEAHDENGEH